MSRSPSFTAEDMQNATQIKDALRHEFRRGLCAIYIAGIHKTLDAATSSDGKVAALVELRKVFEEQDGSLASPTT